MSRKLQWSAVGLAVLITAAAGTGAVADDAPMPAPATTAQEINPSADQAQALLKTLEGFAVQEVENFAPKAGAKIPDEVKTTPMPAASAATLPAAKDQHIVKTDDNTVVIVDPFTREIVSVITALEGATQQNTSAPDAGK
jgi:hypothetical protein